MAMKTVSMLSANSGILNTSEDTTNNTETTTPSSPTTPPGDGDTNSGESGTESGGENTPTSPIIPEPYPIDTKVLGKKQDRFAIIPLYTKWYKYALNGEYMIDEHTGASGIKMENGKVVMDSEEGRLRYHIETFESELGYYGMRKALIKQAYFDDDSYIHIYRSGTNLLDDPIYIDDQKMIKKLCISLDLDILESVEDTPKMKFAEIDPQVIVKYTVDMGKRQEYECKLSVLRNTIEELNTISLAINQIILPSDTECILENCHIIIHSILIGLIEEDL